MAIFGVFKMNPHIAQDLLKIYQYMSLNQLKNMKLSGIKQFQSKKCNLIMACVFCAAKIVKKCHFWGRKSDFAPNFEGS